MTSSVNAYEQFVEPIKRRLVFEDDGWCIYKWDARKDYLWSRQFTMWHKCGIENDHAVKGEYRGKLACVRCEVNPPNGLVALFEMLNWKDNGYGG